MSCYVPVVLGDVCDASGIVRPALEERRRGVIASELAQDFGQADAQVLLSAFDAGRFNPHPAAERGVPGEYLVVCIPQRGV